MSNGAVKTSSMAETSGFYKPEKEADYAALAARSDQKTMGV